MVTTTAASLPQDATCDQPQTMPADYFRIPDEDNMVDWYGVNIFSNTSAPTDTTCVPQFLQTARERGFPVLFAETTPRYVGSMVADGAWDKWYGPM